MRTGRRVQYFCTLFPFNPPGGGFRALLIGSFFFQGITRAAPAVLALLQDTVPHQLPNIAQGRIWRTLCQLGVFGAGQFSLKSDQQAVDDSSLGFIRRILVGLMPYVSLAKDSAQRFVGSINSPPKAAEEPIQPRRDIQAALLGALKYIFIYIILL